MTVRDFSRATITRASRVMVPMYIAFSGYVGACWILQDSSRGGPALGKLGTWWPVSYSGAVLFTLAGAMLLFAVTGNRALVGIAIAADGVAYLGLCAAFTIALLDTTASFSAPAWPLGWAIAHIASLASLTAGEYHDDTGVDRRWQP